MKQMLMYVVTAFVIASLLSMPAPVGAASAKTEAAPSAISQGDDCLKPANAPLRQDDQQTGFRWQLTTELPPEASSAAVEAAALLESSGVKTTLEGSQLTMNGVADIEQLRTAIFDTASPFSFLGGAVDMTIYLPADGTPVTLNLEARNTTGYVWMVVPDEGSMYAQSGEPVFSMRYEGYGAPSIQTIQLDSIGTGDTSVHLVYRRPFEADAPLTTQLNIWMPAVANVDLSDPTPTALESPDSSSSVAEEPSALDELLPKALPASWDWRAQGIVTPIRDQGGCGSCWAFGTVGAMEAVLKKSGGPLADLSEQYLVSCNKEGWSCSGGWDTHDYHYNVLGYNQTQAGAVLESDKPYTQTNGSCTTALNHPYKLTGWGYVGGLNSGNYWYSIPTYEQLKNAIYTYGPITAGVCVGSGFNYYSGGLFTTDETSVCGYSPNHLIVLVGWNDADQSLILRNSWDTWWGEDGYMRIKYGTSMVGIAPTWVVRSSASPIPTPYTPSGTSSTTKPAYVWSRVGTTASYKLQVYDIAAAAYKVNTTVSSSYCNATTGRCTYTPNVVLTNNKNYRWRAAAGSGTWSAFKTFKVSVVSGFNSQFTSNAAGWSRVYGTWGLANSSYKTVGVPYYWSSIKHTNTYKNFTYQARLKRTGCTGCSNTLIIRGKPTTLNSDMSWRSSFIFNYTNNGSFSVWKLNPDGTEIALKYWTSHSAIAKNNWNILKVVANGSSLKYYINNKLVWSGSNAGFPTGQVGIGMYRDASSTGNVLYADWAKLSILASSNPAAEIYEEVVPGVEIPGGDKNQAP